ncbi:MAG: VOC family protein [Deltaproteobacteria bacterium]|nr:VOC family protein [Deltaproteobacteria bacterium]
MITSVDHIHIHAVDPSATIRFYESHFGAEHLGSIPSGEGGQNHGVNRAIHLTRRALAKQLFK